MLLWINHQKVPRQSHFKYCKMPLFLQDGQVYLKKNPPKNPPMHFSRQALLQLLLLVKCRCRDNVSRHVESLNPMTIDHVMPPNDFLLSLTEWTLTNNIKQYLNRPKDVLWRLFQSPLSRCITGSKGRKLLNYKRNICFFQTHYSEKDCLS